MTTLTAASPWTDLRLLLRVDAALCAVTGLLAAVAAGPLADLLGVSATAVRLVGVALVVWAVDAALLARASSRVVRRTAVAAGVANLAWELASLALVVAGVFTAVGAVAVLVVAAVVGGLGLMQLRAVRG